MASRAPVGRRRRSLLFKLGLALGLALATLVAWEALYRYRLYGWAGFSPTLMNSVHPMGDAGIARATDVPGLRYELKPDLRTWFKMKRFETNARGLRDREYPLEKPADTLRIAVVGDSFTMGSGVAIEDAYHSLLEERLNEWMADGRMECLNFGVAGYGLAQYVAVIEHKALAYDPDFLLIGLVENDLFPPPREHYTTPFEERPPTRPFFHLHSLYEPWLRFQYSRRGDPEGREPRGARPRGAVVPRYDGPEDYLRKSFAAIRERAAAAGVPVLCIHLTTIVNKRSTQLARDLRRESDRHGFVFLDTSPRLRGIDRAEVSIFPNDSHPNERAHALYADVLLDHLIGGGLPAGGQK